MITRICQQARGGDFTGTRRFGVKMKKGILNNLLKNNQKSKIRAAKGEKRKQGGSGWGGCFTLGMLKGEKMPGWR